MYVSESPSSMSSEVSETVTPAVSSSRMVNVPVGIGMSAFAASDSVRLTVSSDSSTSSSAIVTVTLLVVSPGENVRVPLTGV